jgi:hypothetical protein
VSVDKVFERRKGSRKIPVEDVERLADMARDLRQICELYTATMDRKDRNALMAWAAEAEIIVGHCGGTEGGDGK